jgi:hypothetical protein
MATIREQVMEGFRQVLASGVPLVEGRVYAQRTPRLGQGNTPCLSVYFGDDDMRPITASSPRVIEHNVSLVVAGYSSAPSESVDAVLDQIAEQIETALYADKAWRIGGLVKSLTPDRIRLPDPQDREYPQGLVNVAYSIVFHTVEGQPSQAR